MSNFNDAKTREEKIEAIEEFLAEERYKGFKKGCIMTLAALLVMSLLSYFGGFSWLPSVIHGDRKLNTIEYIVDKYYLFQDKADKKAANEATYKGYVDALGDPYSAYLTKEEFKEFNKEMEGTQLGVGIIFTMDTIEEGSFPRVVEVIQGNSAEKNGVRSEDLVISVDGKSVRNMDMEEIGSLLKGEEGTNVTLEIKREATDEVFSVTLTREKIKGHTVFPEVLDGQVGYIRINHFERNTSKEFKKAVDGLMEKNVKGLVIDVRNNPGGFMDTTVEMLDYLLAKNKLVTTVHKDGSEQVIKGKTSQCVDLPMAILINGGSASASELFSGTMQDYGKAVIVGSRSFGKGIVQNVYPLNDGSAVRITIAEYLTGKGRHIHKKGVMPDIKVSESRESFFDKNDAQLDKAKEYIEKEAAKK